MHRVPDEAQEVAEAREIRRHCGYAVERVERYEGKSHCDGGGNKVVSQTWNARAIYGPRELVCPRHMSASCHCLCKGHAQRPHLCTRRDAGRVEPGEEEIRVNSVSALVMVL